MSGVTVFELLDAADDGALWCDHAGVIRAGEVDVTDQVKAAERTGLLQFGVDEYGNEAWVPSPFGAMVLRRAACLPVVSPPSLVLLAVMFPLAVAGLALHGEVGGLLLFAAVVCLVVYVARLRTYRRAVRA